MQQILLLHALVLLWDVTVADCGRLGDSCEAPPSGTHPIPVEGRPFTMDDGAALVASVTSTNDASWSMPCRSVHAAGRACFSALTPGPVQAPARPVPTPTPAQAAAASKAWADAALHEHASIASFSRFALELLAVGAPSALVDDSLSAARDEVRHARLSFALAELFSASDPEAPQGDAYGLGSGPSWGPSALVPPNDVVAVSSRVPDVIRRAIREGCVGETLAAARAAAARQLLPSPGPGGTGRMGALAADVAQALDTIGRDEAKHAALAWRAALWAAVAGERRGVAGVFEEIVAEQESLGDPEGGGLEPPDWALAPLSPANRQTVDRFVTQRLVVPWLYVLGGLQKAPDGADWSEALAVVVQQLRSQRQGTSGESDAALERVLEETKEQILRHIDASGGGKAL